MPTGMEHSAWNTLPRRIRETVDSATFRKLLKTPSTSSDFFTTAVTVLSPFYIYINF